METIVTSYFVPETQELVHDTEALDKWLDTINALGLKGQSQLTSNGMSPIPFLPLTSSLLNIFDTLCPRKVDLKDFDIQPIPVHVLDLIALSVKENYFQKIKIAYNDREKDPVVIGEVGHWYQPTWKDGRDKSLDGIHFKSKEEALNAGIKESDLYYNNTQNYAIARWGDMAYSLEQLKEMAVNKYKESEKLRLEKEIRDAERRLEDLDYDINQRFN